LCNGKKVFFVHGYNVDEERARAWGAEMFKRLYWSGSRAAFFNVTWYGDAKGGFLPEAAYYHLDVINAFKTASNLAAVVNAESGTKCVIAHSLGVMLASSAISDYGMEASPFIMVNAAVPMEAYDVNEQYPLEMHPPEWRDFTNRVWASEWHKLWAFDPSDRRNDLTWRNRFKAITQAIHYYSTGEDVLRNNQEFPPNPESVINIVKLMLTGEGAWCFQELVKGGPIPALLWDVDSHGGWGFNAFYDSGVLDPETGPYIIARTPEQAATLSDDILRQESFLSVFT
jgi:hypothetical protein